LLRQDRGSGRLGLHVSRRLARVLGGDLTVTSDAVEGTAFAASIPVSLADDAALPVSMAAAAAPAEAAPAVVQPPVSSSEPAEVDTGVLPFLPADMPVSESFVSMQERGLVSIAADLLLANTTDAYVACEGPYVRYLSPGALAMLQYANIDEAPTMQLDYVHPDDVAAVKDRLAEAAARSAQQGGATVTFVITFRGQRKDGSYLWMESRACATPTHLYTATTDISDRVQREASLRGFLASVMADMRTPLTSVQAASELLAAQRCVRGDEESAFLVSAISAGCAMLMGIVSNVLSFRSMEAGECAVEVASCCVRSVVANVLGVIRMSLAHRRDISIVWADEAEALPARVLCDKRLLSHVLLNLLTSACPRMRVHMHTCRC
jgi:signal transduction histidine kinase